MYSYCYGLKLIIQSQEKASKGKTEHVGGLVLISNLPIFLSRQNILLWSVYVKYCVTIICLSVWPWRYEWGWVCVCGRFKKKKDCKIPRWKGSRSKRQTLSIELSQHVPITAALRQSPDRRFFWPILRAGGDQRKIFEGKRRVVYWEKHTVSGEEKSGQNEGGMVTVTYSIRERLKMRDRGHKQVRRWEHWSMKGYREERQHATVSPC